MRVHVFLDPDLGPDQTKTKFLDSGPTRTDPDSSRFFTNIWHFLSTKPNKWLRFQLFNSYSRKKVNIKFSLIIFPNSVLFKFEAKYQPGLKLYLNIDPDPTKKKKLDPEPTGSGSESGRTRSSLQKMRVHNTIDRL